MPGDPRPSRLAAEILRRGAWAPSAVFGVHLFLSFGLHLYGRVEWLDIVVHTAGGAAIALFFARALIVLQEHGVVPENKAWLEAVQVLALVASAAVLWEFAEFVSGEIGLAPVGTGAADPISDLFFGLVGGALFLVAEARREATARGSELEMSKRSIRPIAVCACRKGDRVLVELASDHVEDERFFQLIGGGIEFGERAADAVRREWREELGAELDDLQLLGVLENLFTYEGLPGHEIVFVFEARMRDAERHSMETFEVKETNGQRHVASWMLLAELERGDVPVYPSGVLGLLGRDDG